MAMLVYQRVPWTADMAWRWFISRKSLQAAMARFVAEVEEAIIVLCKELNRLNRWSHEVVVKISRGKRKSQEMRDDFFPRWWQFK